MNHPKSMDTLTNIKKELDHRPSISLEEVIAQGEFMSRIEEKFIIPIEKVIPFLKQQKELKILTINSQNIFTYTNEYFDTYDFHFYKLHHNKHKNRCKVRIRNYDNNTSFIEVKFKNNKSQSIKERLPYKNNKELNSTSFKDLLSKYTTIEPESLTCSLVSKYKRITLVSPDFSFRLTIDFYLTFVDGKDKTNIKQFPNLAVIEVKSSSKNTLQLGAYDGFNKTLTTFSKYCIGIASLNPTIKQNRFKDLFRQIEKHIHA